MYRPGPTPGWGTINFGRFALRETFLVTEDNSRGLSITGQTSVSGLSAEQVERIYEDLYGLSGQFIPITWTDKSFLDGYYKVGAVTTNYASYTPGVTSSAYDRAVVLDWTLNALRIGPSSAIDIESRLTGPQTRANDFGLLGEITHAPPVGHYGYTTGGTVPPIVTRVTEDGPIQVYRQIPQDVNPRYGCAPDDFGGGRVRFTDSFGEERTGVDRRTPATGWTLSNGLVKISPGAAGSLTVSSWTPTGWQSREWDVTRDGASVAPFADADMLHNTYDTGVLRLLTPRSPGRTITDVQLRRGSRMVELFVQADSSATLAVKLHTGEPGVASLGTVSSVGEGFDGGRYVISTARTATLDTINGGISQSAARILEVVLGAIPAADPLNPNYSFESGTTGWSATGATLTQSTDQAKYGTYSGKVVTDGTSSTASLISSNIGITPLTRYTAAAWVFCAHGRPVTVTLDWLNPGGSVVATVTKPMSLLANTWVPVLLDVASPATATQARLTVTITQTTPWSAINGLAWNTLGTWGRPIAFVETFYVDAAPLRPALSGDSVADMLTQALGNISEVVLGVRR